MLERIEEIQGIGLLHKVNGKPYTCKKATLIYADNGRGKSTLATVLRSASIGDATLIARRKTIDGSLPPKVMLQFGSGHKVIYSGSSWSETRPEILVFDSEFVERNVHSGGAVNTGHRKNLLEFALGESAVTARKAVDKATSDAKSASDNVQSLEAQLAGYHGGLTLAQFENLLAVPDADTQIDVLQKRISAARNIAAIFVKRVPSVVTEPTFDVTGLFSILSTSLEDIHADAEHIVREHAQKLGGNNAENWLSQGQQFEDTGLCPYCAQDIANNNLIQAYKTRFNASYNALKKKVSALYDTVATGTNTRVIETFVQSVVVAKAHAEAWNEHVHIQPISFEKESAISSLIELQELVLDLVRRKQASPVEPFGSTQDLEKATKLWQEVLKHMQATNAQIKAASALIVAYKEQLTTDNVQQLQQQVLLLQASKQRHSPVVVDLINQLTLARSAASTADNAKKREREKLDTLMTKTLQQYEKSINGLLKNFGASFSIKGMGANFRGSAPRSEYGLLLRGKEVALEGGSLSFATILSEGDKRTLAFAFFIASTITDAKLATRIIVIDDPMCSLDLNRKHYTRSVLKKLHSKTEQLIMLAHDPYFIRDLRDAIRKDDASTPITLFQLATSIEEYTDFAQFDVDKECESPYSKHHRLLTEFVDGKGGDTTAISKTIRPMLEGYLHRRFPGLLPKSLMFGQVITLIRDAVPPSPLCHAKNLVNELNEINDYAGQFHHDTNPDADLIKIVASELRSYVNRALLVVHGGILSH